MKLVAQAEPDSSISMIRITQGEKEVRLQYFTILGLPLSLIVPSHLSADHRPFTPAVLVAVQL